MDPQILQSFCDDTRNLTRAPFNVGDYTVATDGYILLRVPRLAEVADRDDAPKIEMVATDGTCGIFFREPAQWVPLPTDAIKLVPCDTCGGTGLKLTCPECDGQGEVSLDSDYNTYDEECKTCNGEGTLSESGWALLPQRKYRLDPTPRPCGACENGKVCSSEGNLMVGEAQMNPYHLHRLGKLPGPVELGVVDKYAPVRFRFAGGDGLVVPMRPV